MSNSVDPDLYCLQKPIIIACGSERVNNDELEWINKLYLTAKNYLSPKAAFTSVTIHMKYQ